jgi:hypothetical protein
MTEPTTPAWRRRALLHGLAAVAVGLPAVAGGAAATPTPWVWRSRFEAGLAGWPGLGPVWGRHNQRFLADAEVDGRLLRVALPRGGIDPGTMRRRGLPAAGTGFKARILAGGSDAATLHYRLRFPAGFHFVRGGKLPGLFGGTGPSGGHLPDGRDGFSLRLMWREHGAGEVYAYLPDSRVHGTSLLHGRFAFVPGRWHELVQAVRLNTPGRADGVLGLWLDGRAAGRVTGLRLRDLPELRVDGVFVDVFFGGNDDSWAPQADSHVDLADFALADAAPGL